MFNVVEINKQVYKIVISQPIQGDVNIFVIKKDKVTLIDSGHPSKNSQNEVISGLSHLGLSPKDVDQIILTHRHIDHIGGIVGEDSSFDNAKVIAYKAYSEPIILLDSFETIKKYIPIEIVDKIIDITVIETYQNYYSYFRPLRIDEFVNEGEIIDIGGGEQIDILHTPGHSYDHISLYHTKTGILFGGDVLLENGPPIIDCLDQYSNSLELIKTVGATAVLPGHGNVIHSIHDTIIRTQNRIVATDQKIIDSLKKGIDTPYHLALEFTGGKVNRGIKFFIEVVLNHLERMVKNNQVELLYRDEVVVRARLN